MKFERVTISDARPVTGWIVPAIIIVLIEYLFVLAVGAVVGLHNLRPHSAYLVLASTASAIGVVVFLVDGLIKAIILGDHKVNWPSYFAFVAGAFLVALQMCVLISSKIMLPQSVGFWADPFLANVDAVIFGQDPWRLTQGLADPLLEQAYMIWPPLMMVFLISLLASPHSALKSRCLVAWFLILAGGALGQYLLPSAGPLFYERIGLGPRFADMPVQPWTGGLVDYLWTAHETKEMYIGSGISAWPSVHVAVALWMALVIRSYFPRLQLFGFAYFALILIGSVHLGWHYSLDGIGGALIALLAWSGARQLRLRSDTKMTAPRISS